MILLAILIPEYRGYVSTCVNHERSDTFLSANLAALGINYASYQGNKDLAIGINNYNSDLMMKCNEQSDSTSSSPSSQLFTELEKNGNSNKRVTYVNYLKILHDQNASLSESIVALRQLNQCVDVDLFYAQYCQLHASDSSSTYCKFNNSRPSSSTCDVKYLLTPSIFTADTTTAIDTRNRSIHAFPEEDDVISQHSSYLTTNQTKTSNLTEVIYSNAMIGQTRSTDFYCSQLPPCEVTCAGPDLLVVDNAAKDCSCMVEWYWNGMLLQLSFAFIIYLIVNISR